MSSDVAIDLCGERPAGGSQLSRGSEPGVTRAKAEVEVEERGVIGGTSPSS